MGDERLPRAGVMHVLREAVGPDRRMTGEFVDKMSECCNEFIHIVTFQAGAAAESEGKKIVTAEHVLKALEQLEFKGLLEGVRELGDPCGKVRERKKRRPGET